MPYASIEMVSSPYREDFCSSRQLATHFPLDASIIMTLAFLFMRNQLLICKSLKAAVPSDNLVVSQPPKSQSRRTGYDRRHWDSIILIEYLNEHLLSFRFSTKTLRGSRAQCRSTLRSGLFKGPQLSLPLHYIKVHFILVDSRFQKIRIPGFQCAASSGKGLTS